MNDEAAVPHAAKRTAPRYLQRPATVAAVLEAAGGRLVGARPNGPLERLVDPSDAEYGSLAASSVVVLTKGTPAPEPGPALLVSEGSAAPARRPLLLVPDARLALAKLSELFWADPGHDATTWEGTGGKDANGASTGAVDGGAFVHPSAVLGEGVKLAPFAVVGAGARLGARTSVGAHSVVGAGVTVGRGCVIAPHVTLYPGTRIGDGTTVHAGAVIGADGFGFATSERGAVKIYHLGGVLLGDGVEVGANTCIDRGTLLDTTVGNGVKIDNHCQIGHNVRIGDGTVIAGMTGVAGSTVVGRGVIIGGNVGVSDHVTIGDGARIGGGSGVTKSVPAGESWAGYPAKPYKAYVRDLYLVGRLEQVWKAVKPLLNGRG